MFGSSGSVSSVRKKKKKKKKKKKGLGLIDLPYRKDARAAVFEVLELAQIRQSRPDSGLSLKVIDSCGVPQEQKIIKGHLPRVIDH